MVDPITTLATVVTVSQVINISKAAKAAIDWLRSPERATQALQSAEKSFDEMSEIAIATYVAKQEAEAPDKEAYLTALVEMIHEKQFAKVQKNLEFEAVREATDERIRLLAAAAAGLYDVDLSINQKARTERTLRQLDREDVLFLDELDRFDDAAFAPNPNSKKPPDMQRAMHNDQNRSKAAESSPASRSALLTAGCIAEDSSRWGNPCLGVTPLGRIVLRVLDAFIKEERRAG